MNAGAISNTQLEQPVNPIAVIFGIRDGIYEPGTKIIAQDGYTFDVIDKDRVITTFPDGHTESWKRTQKAAC